MHELRCSSHGLGSDKLGLSSGHRTLQCTTPSRAGIHCTYFLLLGVQIRMWMLVVSAAALSMRLR